MKYISDATVNEICEKHVQQHYDRGRWVLTIELPPGLMYENQPIKRIQLGYHKTLDGKEETYARRRIAEKYVEVMGLQ